MAGVFRDRGRTGRRCDTAIVVRTTPNRVTRRAPLPRRTGGSAIGACAILRRNGPVLNRKRTQRLCREKGLSMRRRRGRKRAIGTGAPRVSEAVANARWPVDFAARIFGSARTSSPTGGVSAFANSSTMSPGRAGPRSSTPRFPAAALPEN